MGFFALTPQFDVVLLGLFPEVLVDANIGTDKVVSMSHSASIHWAPFKESQVLALHTRSFLNLQGDAWHHSTQKTEDNFFFFFLGS